MKISLKQAIFLLENSTGIIFNDHVITYANPDADDDIFLTLSWVDENYEYDENFSVDKNQEIELIGSSLFLTSDSDEEPMQITLLTSWDAEKEIGGANPI